MRILLLILALGCLTTISCNNKPQETQEQATGLTDFEIFYNKFHQDSLYQLDHIVFPLEGLPRDVDSTTLANKDFKWQKEDWVMHRKLGEGDQDFRIEWTNFGPDLVIEKIIHGSETLGMVRRFAKMGDEWYLIYYAGLNRIAQEENISIEGGF